MCGPHRLFAPLLPHTLRRIPQAVGVVATFRLISGMALGIDRFQYRRR